MVIRAEKRQAPKRRGLAREGYYAKQNIFLASFRFMFAQYYVSHMQHITEIDI